ncbi:MAG: TonB-dependent receptor plug domain-containing protein, partial [Sphingobacteriaceae bacterium]
MKPKHTLNPFKKIILATCCLFTASTAGALAQTADLESLSLEDLLNIKITTVAKSQQSAGEAPATVIVVTAKQIKTRGYRNLSEVLNDLPDVKLNDKSDPQYFGAVNIRGIDRQDRFVVLMDGIKISSPTNDPLPVLENYPIYLAKQIEVVFGPGSALYGADAMSGVINIITDEGSDNNAIKATAMVGSQGYNSQHFYIRKRLGNDFNLSAAGQYTYDQHADFSKVYPDDYSMKGQQTGTFNSAYGLMSPSQPLDGKYSAPVKTYNMYLALEKQGFDFKLLHHYSQVPSSTTLKPDNGVYNKDVFYGQGITSASVNYTDSIGILKSVTTLQGNFSELNPKSNFRNLYGSMEHGYKYGYGSMVKMEEQLSASLTENMQLTGGLTYEIFKSLPKTVELAEPQLRGAAVDGILLNSTDLHNPDGIAAKFYQLGYHNIGAYLQGQYNPIEKLAVTVGARYDQNSRFGSTLNPRLGLVFKQSPKTIIKALYGTAYWAPSPHISYEQYGSFYTEDQGQTYKADFWHLANPGLKPSSSETFEFSINQQVKSYLNVTLTGYYTHIHDLITNVSDNGNTNLYNNKHLGFPVSYIEVPINSGQQTIFGGNLHVNSVFNIQQTKLNVWSSLSLVDGFIDQSVNLSQGVKVQIPFISPWQFRAGVDGYSGNFNYSVRMLQSSKQRVTTFDNVADPYKRRLIDGYT